MKWIAIALVLLFMSISAFAEQKLFYKTYKEKSREVVDETSFHIGDLTDGKIVVQWKSQETGDEAEYALNTDYATQSWKVVSTKEGNDYAGERKGDQLLIKGKHKGKEIDKKIKINDRDFFFHPSLGLSGFARSGKESLEFWVLRPDKLKGYKMKAKRLDEETITLNGIEVETVSVKWGLTGLLSKFVNQTSWYRKSDGVFVRSSAFRGTFMELVNEQ